MSILPKILNEVVYSDDENFVMKSLRKSDKSLQAKGFGRTEYNKNSSGQWSSSKYVHGEYPHEVTLSMAKHHKTGKPFLNINYTVKDHKSLGSHEELEKHLNDKNTFPKAHWWS